MFYYCTRLNSPAIYNIQYLQIENIRCDLWEIASYDKYNISSSAQYIVSLMESWHYPSQKVSYII